MTPFGLQNEVLEDQRRNLAGQRQSDLPWVVTGYGLTIAGFPRLGAPR